MAKLQNLQFTALNVSGDNYLSWVLDAEVALISKGLGDCIVEGNNENERNKCKAISLIRHHLVESLKDQYVTLRDPMLLWKELKDRYYHQKIVLKPKAQYDWKNLRIQDFKSVDDYNSELFKTVSILRLCGEEISDTDLVEKTLSTFHPNNVLLQQQYRGKGFETYSSLISCLILAEKNNELLFMNSTVRPPGSTPIPEANKASTTDVQPKESKKVEANYAGGKSSYGRGRGRGRSGGRGHYQPYGRGNHSGGKGRGGKGQGGHKPHKANTGCFRCGMGNHWEKNCRTPKHLCDAYQEKMRKNPESNLVHLDGDDDFDHENDDLMDYETSDYLKENE